MEEWIAINFKRKLNDINTIGRRGNTSPNCTDVIQLPLECAHNIETICLLMQGTPYPYAYYM